MTRVSEKVRKRHSSSLFARTVFVLLGVIIASQMINFILLILVPLPTPRITSLDQVAEALRAGRSSVFRVSVEQQSPFDDFVDGEERTVSQRLAVGLGVPQSDIKVVLSRPGSFDTEPHPTMMGGLDGPPPATPQPPRRDGTPPPLPPFANVRNGDILVGSFAASRRLGDHRWLTVRPDIAPIARWQIQALLWLLATIAVVMPFAWVLARRLAIPIQAFADAADQLGKNPQGAPIRVDGPAEIEVASRALNRMQQRLNRYVDERMSMVGAMAHDIGTPLHRLSFKLENAPEGVRNAAAADIAEMSAMIGAALAFVRNATEPTHRHKVSLQSIIQSVAGDLEDEGFDVEVTDGTAPPIEVDAVGMKRVIDNLARNAVRYGGNVRLQLGHNADECWIKVTDDGPGIPSEDLDRVFEPFFRVERSRNRDTGGVGLGLASALTIVRAHGGDISLSNREFGGLEALVRLPR